MVVLALLGLCSSASGRSFPPGWITQAKCIHAYETGLQQLPPRTAWVHRWNLNTGNGQYGGFQFSLYTWRSVGGVGLPSTATVDEQTYRAYLVWKRDGGWREWTTASLCVH